MRDGSRSSCQRSRKRNKNGVMACMAEISRELVPNELSRPPYNVREVKMDAPVWTWEGSVQPRHVH